MREYFKGKNVIVVGATGGLGSGIVKAFASSGARLLLAGRNEEKLSELVREIKGDITNTTIDVTVAESIEKFRDFAWKWSEKIDIVVNVSGYDVRKSLDDHSVNEVEDTLRINLLGTILLTKIFLPIMKNNKGSLISHIGGFADGRMAFPYYSVDVASRSGVFSFIESINRELELEGSQTRVFFFCPSPADTDAERPFHSLWKQMGVKIQPVENVADALLNAIEKRKSVSIMGGTATVIFAKLNSIMPKLADFLVMKNYGRMLKDYLYRETGSTIQLPNKRSKILNRIAIVLVVLSFVLYGLIFAVPFLPLSIAHKAVAIPILVATGEATWWIGVALVGKQVISKYRRYLNPCYWFVGNKCNSST